MVHASGARTVELPGGIAAAWSDVIAGDLRPSGPGLSDGRPLAGFVGSLAASTQHSIDAVAWATQVHGSVVIDVAPPDQIEGLDRPVVHMGEGDALVSSTPGIGLCILTADCGPVALSSPEGVFAAVHAGWRGLLDGVIERTVERMRAQGATEVVGALGPCIHAECYAFDSVDLDVAAATYGETVRGATASGQPALDLTAGIIVAAQRAGVPMIDGVDVCTSCGAGYFSHRARQDRGRQALVVWSTRESTPQ